ncbi:hypothetical protein [Methylobacterium gnaphalii]|uniref:HTH HARE-type domain-containing protein n=1 Tax=Methylobacterium gnaphalii TaxID=1010610 RepID=A0A512JNH1_9HYPH|nr:hypothetical protein [Methylobacterium gnaphalii]GEP11478.1 hypothetical protein MGN01_33230 [Methylobacterium gnaphalii]GJD70188.1 hypothetical protein MMMDOFMJ_3130 [Methylobacterium gnaphalii]GLS49482.1 hypothetical protein GCM10007885_23310 [Methylobacterium gnaphalii]
MVLSEAEAEAQLLALHRQREALDRAIADLTLYLELGRRLTKEAGLGNAPAPGPAMAPGDVPLGQGGGRWNHDTDPHRADLASHQAPPERHVTAPGRAPATPDPRIMPSPAPVGASGSPPAGPPAAGAPHPVEGALSEGVLARRYGRALIEAAIQALREAGRPLHASEILAVLTSRGFSLPGHDAVAALNTRLWKRSGPGGPLARMGDAVYALAEAGGEA